MHFDAIKLIFAYIDNIALSSLRSVSTSWKKLIKFLLKQRVPCVLCNKPYSPERSHLCHYHPGYRMEYIPKNEYKTQNVKVNWTCCNGPQIAIMYAPYNKGCQTRSGHSHVPSKIWSFTPFDDDYYVAPIHICRTFLTQDGRMLPDHSLKVVLLGKARHPIREEDSRQVRKLFGAVDHVHSSEHKFFRFDQELSPGPSTGAWVFTMPSDLMPPMWETLFSSKVITSLYYQMNPLCDAEIEKPSDEIEKVSFAPLSEGERVVMGGTGVLAVAIKK